MAVLKQMKIGHMQRNRRVSCRNCCMATSQATLLEKVTGDQNTNQSSFESLVDSYWSIETYAKKIIVQCSESGNSEYYYNLEKYINFCLVDSRLIAKVSSFLGISTRSLQGMHQFPRVHTWGTCERKQLWGWDDAHRSWSQQALCMQPCQRCSRTTVCSIPPKGSWTDSCLTTPSRHITVARHHPFAHTTAKETF